MIKSILNLSLKFVKVIEQSTLPCYKIIGLINYQISHLETWKSSRAQLHPIIGINFDQTDKTFINNLTLKSLLTLNDF